MHGSVTIKVPRWLAVVAAVLGLGLFLTACNPGATDASEQDAKSRTQTAQGLAANQPVHKMAYSSSRDTINFWIDTWGRKGAVSYVYLLDANGEVTNSYVLKGLPVSYCTGITRPYDKTAVDLGEYDGSTIVPAPGVDGVYYSGGDCQRYYGRDNTTGAYVEFSVGMSQQMLLFDKPLPGSYKQIMPGKAAPEKAGQ